MQVKYINPFIEAVVSVLDVTAKLKMHKKGLELVKNPQFSLPYDISAIIGMTGQIKGQVIYSMGMEFAKNFTSSLLMGMPIDEVDHDMTKSGVNEMVNMITGNATNILNDNDVVCELSIPSIMEGQQIIISPQSIPSIKLKFDSEWGEMVIFVTLKD